MLYFRGKHKAGHTEGIAMDLQALQTILNNLNEKRFNNEISHQAWWITVQAINATITDAGYTWDELVSA
jgi:hypothetical protein